MASKAVNARSGRSAGKGSKKAGANEPLPPATFARRAAWVLGAAAWVFISVALATFDSADPPSHVVAVYNEPVANVCGVVGAYAAYWSYSVLGWGVWVLLACAAGVLGVTVTGRVVTHPIIRASGALFMLIAVSGAHGLFLSETGPLAGAHAGLIADWLVGTLQPEFHAFGTGLILFGALSVGAVIAVDQVVFALPRVVLRGLGIAQYMRLPQIRLLKSRDEKAEDTTTKRRRSRRALAEIDPDAGGVGATEAFDPDEYEYEDEDEYEDDEWEYEDEYEDDEAEEAPSRRALTAEELREKIAKLPVRIAGQAKTIARDEDIPREDNFEGYQFPTLDMLSDPESNYTEKMESIVRKQAELLEESLQTYGIDGEVKGIESGPTVTLYAVQLAPGTKVSKLSAVSSDLARSMRAQNVRIVPNMVGKTTVGIEVPNIKREKVRLKELMSGGQSQGMVLPMFLGKDASGEPLVADLTRMPHMLIAGTTGSGKSVCMNSIIMSWVYTKRPDELKLVLVDPKMVELNQFADIPHLMCPVVTEMSRAAAILEWAVTKMEERYELLREAMVRDTASYNALEEAELYERFEAESDAERAKIPKQLPYIVFVIDELADLIMTHKETEHSIVRIAQKARAVGIHLILATQRPQANVVTGLIKSNMPCRVAFKVASGMDSRIVLDQKGGELLLGNGDMLFLTPHTSEVKRAQGTLIEDAEIRKVVRFLKTVAAPNFERTLITLRADGTSGDDAEGLDVAERDPMFDEAVRVMIESGRGSVSLLQRRLAIGYSRASRLVDQMALAGILGEHKGSVAREVLITLEDWDRMKELEEAEAANGTLFMEDEDELDEAAELAHAEDAA